MHFLRTCLATTAPIVAMITTTPAQSCPTSDEWNATASDGIRYGRAVDIDGDFLVIGDYSANSYTGRVYLRAWDGAAWSDPQVLDGVGAGESFGAQLGLSAGWIAVSVPDYNSGAVDLYSHDGSLWNYEDSYETGVGYTLLHTAFTYPWLAVAERSDDGTVVRLQMLQHDAGEDTWPVIQTIDMPADSGYSAFVSLTDDLLAVGLPNADVGANVDCGAVLSYGLSGGVWSSLGSMTMNHADGNYGQVVAIDATTDTLVFARHGAYVSGTFNDAVVVAKRFNGLTWDAESISGSLPWSADESQINYLALEGDDLVVVLWNLVLGEWSTHHLHRSSGVWSYQGEFGPSDADGNLPRYVAAMHDGMLVMDGGTDSTERVVWVLPVDDCDATGMADACEALIPGADGNSDGFLDRCMCPGDLDFNNERDGADIISFLGLWAGGTAAGDLDADGQVGVLDLLIILTQWGTCP